MDITPLLVGLNARLSAPDGGEADKLMRNSVETALHQWDRGYLHVTKLRRQAVVTAFESKSEFMLADPDVFTVVL